MIDSWKFITEQFNLETLHIDNFHSFKHGQLQAHHVNSLPVQVVIHTTISSIAYKGYDDYGNPYDYEDFEDQHFSQFIDFLAGINNLKGLVIDHDDQERNRRWTLHEFKQLILFPLRKVDMVSLHVTDENTEEFIQLFSKLKCKVDMYGDRDVPSEKSNTQSKKVKKK